MTKPRIVNRVQVYALYQGDDLLSVGTAREIAEERGVKRNTITFLGSPSYKQRLKPDSKALVAHVVGTVGDGEW